MTYWEMCIDHIDTWGKITTKVIQEITPSTCPHSVAADLRKHKKIDDGEWVRQPGTKDYKIFHRLPELF